MLSFYLVLASTLLLLLLLLLYHCSSSVFFPSVFTMYVPLFLSLPLSLSLFLAPTNVFKRQVNSTFCSAVLCLWACFCGVFMLPIIWLYSNVLCLLWERVLHCTHKSESKMKSNSNNNTVDIIKETEEKQQKKQKQTHTNDSST